MTADGTHTAQLSASQRARLEGAEAYLRQLMGHRPTLTMEWLKSVTEALREVERGR